MIYNQADMSMLNKKFIYSDRIRLFRKAIDDLFTATLIILVLSAICASGVYLWNPIKERPDLPSGLHWVSISESVRENPLWVDAREMERFQKGHIPLAINVPMHNWIDGFSEFVKAWDHKRPVVVYCDGGGCLASVEVAERLKKALPKAHIEVLDGGYPVWEKSQKR